MQRRQRPAEALAIEDQRCFIIFWDEVAKYAGASPEATCNTVAMLVRTRERANVK